MFYPKKLNKEVTLQQETMIPWVNTHFCMNLFGETKVRIWPKAPFLFDKMTEKWKTTEKMKQSDQRRGLRQAQKSKSQY